MKLKDKVALITGGAQGLGKSIALAMAREGADIVICDINGTALRTRRKKLRPWRKCVGLRCDVSSSQNVGECTNRLSNGSARSTS